MGSSLPYKIRKTMNFEHLNKVGSVFRSLWVQVCFIRFVKQLVRYSTGVQAWRIEHLNKVGSWVQEFRVHGSCVQGS